ncbi:phosphate ABC transporter substrate-binding protein [Cyanobium sp. ATX 6A2]|uniref:phosphate ABC transporter substrate-binding protein n=1 Tax=Cyanobium sp. ATX 6A2 TaxID=2823700 RepID=UPI0020CE3991|nr:phosphate ABC transporter substrate-binding protein [Cyanobium sp. ATX 6A2]MCP9887436.1 phosphate ABC transporter substrate-binding protein [Cyanobium sp. ATX 6A2]
MTSKPSGGRSGPPPIAYILLVAVALGALWSWREQIGGLLTSRSAWPELPQGLSPGGPAAMFPPPSSVPSGTSVSIDGSTSMVLVNEALKAEFMAAFPGTEVTTAAVGSENGIQALLAGSISLAAISRPLTEQEEALGLRAVPVTRDRIALVVGIANPFRRGLSRSQAAEIFQGTITDWSTLGGPMGPIRVLNRPSVSGTHSAFRSLVLKGSPFGSTPNITTLTRDATTPMLRQLGDDGIGYATDDQVADQRTVRVLPIDGLTPQAEAYPFQRPLFYAYRNPPDPGVKAFLGYALSPAGSTAIGRASSGS